MPSEPGPRGVRQHLHFLGRFLTNPRTIGAIAPSSRVLARQMVGGLDLSGPVTVVELGPGTGSFTSAIVERLGPAGRVLAIELEPAFAAQIRQRWPQVDCVSASAVTLAAIAADRGLTSIDHVISGLPFASLPIPVTRAILDGISRLLRPGGTFTAFQYVYAYALPPAVVFRRETDVRLGGHMTVHLVLRNLPPAFVLRWKKT